MEKFKTFIKAMNIMFTIFIVIHLTVLTVLAYNATVDSYEIIKSYTMAITASAMMMCIMNIIYHASKDKEEDK